MSGGRLPGIRRALRLGVPRRETDDELAFHFEETVAELTRAGLSVQAAREEAARRFGDERRWRRELEAIDRSAAAWRGWEGRWETVRESVRYALRRIRRSPGFALAVVLTFGLGIGANATMFGIVDRLLLRPPPHIEAPGQVRRLMVERFERFTGSREISEILAYPDYEDLTAARSFASVGAYSGRTLTLGQGEDALQVRAVLASAGFFPLLGTRPAIGRFFDEAEERIGAAGTVVLGHGFWRERFGGDPGVLGRTVDFGYGPYTVIGVAPRGFTGMDLRGVDLWLPLRPTIVQLQAGTRCLESRGCHWLRVVGRLAPGVSVEVAEAEAAALHRAGRQAQIAAGRYDAEARLLATPLIAARGPRASGESAVARWLAGISLAVLLIACANVANLLLARTLRQQREIGVRLALGSSRGHVLALVLAESLLLAAAGGVAALLMARWGGSLLRATLLPDVAWDGAALDLRVAGFAFALTLLAGLASGAAPAVQASRPGVLSTLKAGSRGSTAPGSRTRGVLTVLQAALSVMLLVGAGLFVRSLHEVRSLDLGIDPRGVLMVEPVFDRELPPADRDRFFRAAAERLRLLPGIAEAAAATNVPFHTLWSTGLRVPGYDSIPQLPGGGPYINAVSPGYFATMGLRILRGRPFQEADARGTPRVAVVSELMERTLWPAEGAIGQCLYVGAEESPPCTEVIGVVEGSRRSGLVGEGEAMQYFIPLAQLSEDERVEALVARVATGDPSALIPTVQRELLALEPALRFANVRPFQELIEPEARSWRLGAVMFSAFGLLALVVAAVGLYSVLAFSVAQRTLELGIRSALGATRRRLMRLVLGQAVRLVGAGIAIGLALSLLLAPRIEPLLFATSPRDPGTLGAVAAALLLVGVLAGSLPAWRATRVEPASALRAE